MLEASADGDIEFAAGAFAVEGTDSKEDPGGGRVGDLHQPRLAGRCRPHRSTRARPTTRSTSSFPHGTHLCAVEVDTETSRSGSAQLRLSRRHRRHHAAPLIVAGQIRRHRPGSRAGPLGGGGPRRAGHAGDGLLRRLHLPTAADLISFASDSTVSPSTTNDLGAKGVGEAEMHRLHTGRGQRHRGRAPADGRQRRPDAVHP